MVKLPKLRIRESGDYHKAYMHIGWSLQSLLCVGVTNKLELTTTVDNRNSVKSSLNSVLDYFFTNKINRDY